MAARSSAPDRTAGAEPPRVLTRRADFLAANDGLRVARPGFVLLTRSNGTDTRRYGITVTKKIGNAVVRNRIKRRFRALIREILPANGLPGHDHVLIGRHGAQDRDFASLRDDLIHALERAAAGRGDPRRGRRRRSGAGRGRPARTGAPGR